MVETFYWHDYETWGADPRRDRPCQFAGLRTDAELNEIGSADPPLVAYCRPTDDFLPHPDACLVTGLTPQAVERHGLPEHRFARAIHQELSRPGTCSVGYNSIRFDEEVTRFLFYRNFFDPYGHAYRNGNSRWDLIDVVRLAHALRPEGIEWPCHPSGEPSFRLQDLTDANGIDHGFAHDALADVRATLAIARRLRRAQPRLFAYALTLRDKERVRELIAPGRLILHVSSKYPAALGCIAPVLPLAMPSQDDRNGVIVWDLRQDPTALFDLSVEEIRRRVFTAAADLPLEESRLPLKKLRLNAVPMLAPRKTLSSDMAERWAIDMARVDEYLARFRAMPEAATRVARAVREVFRHANPAETPDPDLALYAGFFSEADQQLMARVRTMTPQELAREQIRFADARLGTLLFRYRARNWPETLNESERRQWDEWRLARLQTLDSDGASRLAHYLDRVRELQAQHRTDRKTLDLLDQLAAWPERINARPDAGTRPAMAPVE